MDLFKNIAVDNTHKSAGFVTGYYLALAEFETEATPKFQNPYSIGSEEERGYEEAVYDLTQK